MIIPEVEIKWSSILLEKPVNYKREREVHERNIKLLIEFDIDERERISLMKKRVSEKLSH